MDLILGFFVIVAIIFFLIKFIIYFFQYKTPIKDNTSKKYYLDGGTRQVTKEEYEAVYGSTSANLNFEYRDINCAVTGLYHRTQRAQERATKLEIGEEVFLQRDFDNEYDVYATKVYTMDKIFIGYVEAAYSKDVAFALADKIEMTCAISKVTNHDIPFVYMDIYFK